MARRRSRAKQDAIVGSPNRGFSPVPRVGDPGVQFGPSDAHEPAVRVHPQQAIVVLDRPMNRVAGQTIFGYERFDVAIFNPAKATHVGRGPKDAIPVEKAESPA